MDWLFLVSIIIFGIGYLVWLGCRNSYIRKHGQECDAEIESIISGRGSVITVRFIYNEQKITARLCGYWGEVNTAGLRIFFHPRFPNVAVYYY